MNKWKESGIKRRIGGWISGWNGRYMGGWKDE